MVLCDDLEGVGWEYGGRKAREGGDYVQLQLYHTVVEQKTTQHCKAIILQLKIKFKNRRIIALQYCVSFCCDHTF